MFFLGYTFTISTSLVLPHPLFVTSITKIFAMQGSYPVESVFICVMLLIEKMLQHEKCRTTLFLQH